MVSARPEATWLARSVSVSTPNSARHDGAAERSPPTSASSTLLVAMTAEKPAMAPTIIMPSTPRLRTPERSATSSPVAANTSGVAAIMALIRMLASEVHGSQCSTEWAGAGCGRDGLAGARGAVADAGARRDTQRGR